MTVGLPIALPLLATLLLAAREDARTRRIPIVLVVASLALAFSTRSFLDGGPGALSVLTGLLLAGGLLLPAWFLGWTGAGDVKLMAAVGAWLGAPHGALAVLFSLIAGGAIAFVVATRHGKLRQSLAGAAAMGAWAAAPHAGAPPRPLTNLRYPFAFAALAGTSAALWVRP
jgi:prepilin peptidase CpaA